VFVLYTDGEHFFAVIPRAQIDRFTARLRMYVLRAQVSVEDVSDQYCLFGLATGTAPDSRDLAEPWASTVGAAGQFVIRYGPGQARFLVAVPAAAAAAYWQSSNLPGAGEDCWAALDAYAGMPRLDENTGGEYLPQQLNLDALDALSFSKGCYPGQEIVARLKYRGEVKKRLTAGMYAADVSSDTHVPVRSSHDGRTIGHVLYAQSIGPAQSLVAAVLELNADLHTLAIGETDAAPFSRIDLPYAAG
jgi:folate-binding protein YgfZ